MNPCPECGSINRIATIKLIPTNRQDFAYPKFIPQIKESCGNCGRYIKFAIQTSELIDSFNQKLEGIKCG